MGKAFKITSFSSFAGLERTRDAYPFITFLQRFSSDFFPNFLATVVPNSSGCVPVLSLTLEGPTNITADLKENYFQKFEYEILADNNHPNGFLPGTEFNGSILGFLPIPVEGKPNTSAVVSAFVRILGILKTRSLRFRVATNAHNQAHKDADPLKTLWFVD